MTSSVATIVLAAGESKRMGRNKGLLPWTTGEPLIVTQVYALAEAGYGPIVVVLGHEADQVGPQVPPLPGVTVVEHSGYRQGRSTSVIRGLQALPAGVSGVAVLNVDSPRSAEMLRRLRVAFEASKPALAVLGHHGQEGHPWLFAAALLPELTAITESGHGLREVEARHWRERLVVEAGSPLALTNINTPQEYEAALAMAKAASTSTHRA